MRKITEYHLNTMTNDLKNFLEYEQQGYTEHNFLSDGVIDDLKWLNKHDERLLNFVLSLVEKEVNGLSSSWKGELYNEALDDISTLINNLRV